MRLSVITINYNNAVGLEKTINSVISQDCSDFEYIVIDGASTDESVDIIKKYQDKISYWISEPDSGIYNAMNKGICQANGEYVLFINSGDFLYNKSVVSQIFDNTLKGDLIYGNLQQIFPDGKKNIVQVPNEIGVYHMLRDTIPHPVCLIKRKLFYQYGFYREDLKIVSDWAFFFKVIVFGRVNTKHLPIVIASFDMGGVSNNEKNKLIIKQETEKVLTESFSKELLDICLDFPKYNRFYNTSYFKIFRRLKKILSSIFSWSFLKELVYRKRFHYLINLINKTVRNQKKDVLSIPIIIINYNRLSDLKKMVTFFLERNHKNIVIIDNKSTYPPLLDYYEQIKDIVNIKKMDENYGHLVFWLNKEIYDEFSQGYYVVTDSDIIPNQNLPDNYLEILMHILDTNKKVSKVGFALRIDNIPDTFSQKDKVLEWEKQFWKTEINTDIYIADIDTTFAIYPPKYRYYYPNFYKAIRVAGDFTAIHGGWYINTNKLTDEDKYYFETSNNSNSWKVDKDGDFIGDSLYEK